MTRPSSTDEAPIVLPARLPRVLAIDDEPRLRELLADFVSEMGFAVATAKSAEEGLRAMAADPRDVVLLDLQLPGMSGLECFAALRSRWPATQVIVVTGFGDLDAARKAIHLDVVDFITKPFRLDALELALDRARRRWRGANVFVTERHQSHDASQDAADAQGAPVSGSTLADLEREQILRVLEEHNGNRTKAAAALGISRRTLHYRLREYGQTPE